MLVRWNNSLLINDDMDSRALIYYDEINLRTSSNSPTSDGPGVLICRYSGFDSAASWRRPDDTAIAIGNNNNDFRQFISSSSGLPSRVQLARARNPLRNGASNDGLWTCSGGDLPYRHHVALYARGIIILL